MSEKQAFHLGFEIGIAERLRARCEEHAQLREALPGPLGGLGGMIALNALLPIAKLLLAQVVTAFGPAGQDFLVANKATIESVISDKVFDMAIATLAALKSTAP